MKRKKEKSAENSVEVKLESGKNKTSVFKCQCGADMVYSIKKKMLYCPYCDNSKEIIDTYRQKRDYEIEKNGGTVDTSVKLYECPNCGGQLELDQFEMVKKCPFCGATNCLPVEDFSGLKPDSILPFEIDKDDALEHGKKWIKKKLFAPSILKKEFNVDNFKGMYVPAFSFDTFTQSRYDGRLGYKKTRTVMKNGERTEETYIEWHSVSGNYDKSFVDEIIEATTQLNQKEMNSILPYDIDEVVGYKREYVAGFIAERYDTPLDNSFSQLKIEIEKTIRQDIKREYDADEIDYLNT
ncbi:MAG: hypothetical protein MJ193_05425, partial [Clostridia bacterium]|nr:hypothetical protein [Clostridia bacterium]